MGERVFRVGEVALLFGVHANTVRKWADKGLLSHGRTLGKDGHRLFSLEDVNKARRTLGLPALDYVEAEALLVPYRPKRRRRIL